MKVTIDSGPFPSEGNVDVVQQLGDKCCNLIGENIQFHPIHGNHVKWQCEFDKA